MNCGGLVDQAEVSLSTIPSIAVDSQQGQLKLLTLDPNITSSNIVHNKVLITEEDCEANIDYSSNSFGSSYDKLETNEVHSTVYLPLLSVAFYLGSRLTKNALSLVF
ncbi:Uncharacterized protein APZ42_025948 [Daphnia magna]|uniref:Uncharacterized protein n=1 Tax=Daphnia magna TaxID=35525 RepID=A0A162EEA6_9CRUS|nr:Uncharacterized protein APZ42_025948 [Daphnia magna]